MKKLYIQRNKDAWYVNLLNKNQASLNVRKNNIFQVLKRQGKKTSQFKVLHSSNENVKEKKYWKNSSPRKYSIKNVKGNSPGRMIRL
jgi:hypothetical protein